MSETNSGMAYSNTYFSPKIKTLPDRFWVHQLLSKQADHLPPVELGNRVAISSFDLLHLSDS